MYVLFHSYSQQKVISCVERMHFVYGLAAVIIEFDGFSFFHFFAKTFSIKLFLFLSSESEERRPLSSNRIQMIDLQHKMLDTLWNIFLRWHALSECDGSTSTFHGIFFRRCHTVAPSALFCPIFFPPMGLELLKNENEICKNEKHLKSADKVNECNIVFTFLRLGNLFLARVHNQWFYTTVSMFILTSWATFCRTSFIELAMLFTLMC